MPSFTKELSPRSITFNSMMNSLIRFEMSKHPRRSSKIEPGDLIIYRHDLRGELESLHDSGHRVRAAHLNLVKAIEAEHVCHRRPRFAVGVGNGNTGIADAPTLCCYYAATYTYACG